MVTYCKHVVNVSLDTSEARWLSEVEFESRKWGQHRQVPLINLSGTASVTAPSVLMCCASVFIYGSGGERWHYSIWMNNYSRCSRGSLRSSPPPSELCGKRRFNSASPEGIVETENKATDCAKWQVFRWKVVFQPHAALFRLFNIPRNQQLVQNCSGLFPLV